MFCTWRVWDNGDMRACDLGVSVANRCAAHAAEEIAAHEKQIADLQDQIEQRRRRIATLSDRATKEGL